MSRRSSLIRWLTLTSFIPPALSVVYVVMSGRKGVDVAGPLMLLASAGLLWAVARRAALRSLKGSGQAPLRMHLEALLGIALTGLLGFVLGNRIRRS